MEPPRPNDPDLLLNDMRESWRRNEMRHGRSRFRAEAVFVAVLALVAIAIPASILALAAYID